MSLLTFYLLGFGLTSFVGFELKGFRFDDCAFNGELFLLFEIGDLLLLFNLGDSFFWLTYFLIYLLDEKADSMDFL